MKYSSICLCIVPFILLACFYIEAIQPEKALDTPALRRYFPHADAAVVPGLPEGGWRDDPGDGSAPLESPYSG